MQGERKSSSTCIFPSRSLIPAKKSLKIQQLTHERARTKLAWVLVASEKEESEAKPRENRKNAEGDKLRIQLPQLLLYEPRIHVVSYEGLTTDLAASVGAQFIIRGVRSSIDFEYERSIADVNRMLTGIDTLLLISEPQYAAISSSMVRELARFGKDISPYLP